MKCTWLIEPFAIQKNDRLIESLKRFDIPYVLLSDDKTRPDRELFSTLECALGYTSLQTANSVRSLCWPGFYYNEYNFKCTTYFNYYWGDLLNQGMFLTYEMLRRSKSMVFEKFGNNGAIFIRPNVGFKSFTGTVVTEDFFVKDVEYLGYGDLDKTELILVAEPKNILAEYRVVIAEKKAITMSQYRLNNEYEENGTHIPEVMKYAEDVTAAWQPDKVFVADVAKVTDGYKLIEINSFSCSGLYSCDTDIIAQEVSRVAVEDWKDFNDVIS